MGLKFCMLETPKGDQVAINVDAVVAVRAEGNQTSVVYQGGQIAVKGVVPEIVLKLLAVGAPAEQKLKAAA